VAKLQQLLLELLNGDNACLSADHETWIFLIHILFPPETSLAFKNV
jgi:hypothetical protein